MSAETKKNERAIADWAGDLVALVSHVEEAMDRQLELNANYATTGALIREIHDTVRDDKKRAIAFQESVGSTSGNPVIKAGSEWLGKAAGLIDKLRKDSVAKALRDDYTALNHVVVSYTMFHTTAMALKHSEARQFAEQGMRTYASLVQKINDLLPEAVIQDLVDNKDIDVLDHDVVDECRTEIDRIWRETSHNSSEA